MCWPNTKPANLLPLEEDFSGTIVVTAKSEQVTKTYEYEEGKLVSICINDKDKQCFYSCAELGPESSTTPGS